MKKIPEIKSFRSIAVIQTAFIGDIILSLYMVQHLRFIHPTAKITFVTTPVGASVAASTSCVDEVIVYDKRNIHRGYKGIRFMAEELKSNGIDCILSLHRSFRTTLLSFFSDVTYSVGFNKAALSFLYTRTAKYLKYKHETERNIELLKIFPDYIHNENIHPECIFKDKDVAELESILTKEGIDLRKKTAVLAPGSVWATKRWTPEGFRNLLQMLCDEGYQTVLTGGSEDAELCREIIKNTNGKSLAGMTTLVQSMYFISKSALIVTNDSAPTHMADLVKTPVLTIYGPTSPIFGFAPRGEKSSYIYPDKLKCSPCRIHGSDKCPTGTHECMKKLSAEYVFSELKKII